MRFDANYRQQYDCFILRFSRQGTGLSGRDLPMRNVTLLWIRCGVAAARNQGDAQHDWVRLGPTSPPAIIMSSSSVSA
jgi:hypothetical protein